MKDVARMFVATAVAAVVFVGLYVLLHWSLVISLLLAIGLYIGLTLFSETKSQDRWHRCGRDAGWRSAGRSAR